MKKNILTLAAILAAIFCLPDLSQAQCPTGQNLLTFTLTTDYAGHQTWFRLRDLTDDSILLSAAPGSLGNQQLYMYTLCAPSNHCLKLEIWDTAENGGAQWNINFNGQTLGGQAYTFLGVQVLGSTTCTDFSEVYDGGNYVIINKGKLEIGNQNQFYGAVGGGKRSSICLGQKNEFSEWLVTDTLSISSDNYFGGLNGMDLFLKNKRFRPCNGGNGLPGTSPYFGITPGGLGNTVDCDPTTPIPPSDEEVVLVGEGHLMNLAPGHYDQIIVKNGATLMLDNGEYTCDRLEIRDATLIPNFPGGGVLCDIFIYTKDMILEKAYVQAHVNCETLNGLNDNTFEGTITIKGGNGGGGGGGGGSFIGNNNKFVLPSCDACDNKKHGLAPPQEELELWPNPARDQLHWRGTEATVNDLYMEVYNMEGRQVLQKKLDQGLENSPLQGSLEVGHLPRGLYLYRMYTAEGIRQSGKFLLSH